MPSSRNERFIFATGPCDVDEEEVKKTRTPSDVLFTCLQDFGQDEPLEVVVIYRTQGGDLAWSSNINVHSHFLGVLKYAEFCFLEARRNEHKEER
jgi:hypothetical protein